MPELPEVETVMRGMAPVLEGDVLQDIILRRSGLRLPFPADLAEKSRGQKVERLTRRSKYILVHLSNAQILLLHLGMSGRIGIHGPGETVDIAKHDHVSFLTGKGYHIIFTDPRRFGILTMLHRDDTETHKLLKDIGPEPFGNTFNASMLQAGLARKKSNIKTALLDQKLVAGLGNIYVCEALWRAGINPEQISCMVDSAKLEKLVVHIRDVLTEAIAAGGSSLKDFSHTNGELGYFQHGFKVYDREGDSCCRDTCGDVIARIVQGGRSTYYCPSCQK